MAKKIMVGCDWCNKNTRIEDLILVKNLHDRISFDAICNTCFRQNYKTCQECGEKVYYKDISKVFLEGEPRFICDNCIRSKND